MKVYIVIKTNDVDFQEYDSVWGDKDVADDFCTTMNKNNSFLTYYVSEDEVK